MIKEISYKDILKIWQDELWLDRKDPIEPVSHMRYLGGYHTITANPIFLGWFENDMLVGVNSGHACPDHSYRSRGLWVNPAYRGRGIAKQLLFATINMGTNMDFVWSFPRKDSWKTYESVGFTLTSEWCENINNVNAYCQLQF